MLQAMQMQDALPHICVQLESSSMELSLDHTRLVLAFKLVIRSYM